MPRKPTEKAKQAAIEFEVASVTQYQALAKNGDQYNGLARRVLAIAREQYDRAQEV